MKNLILLLVIFGLSDGAFSEVRPEYSGSWYNPSQSGHGFSIEVISPERTIVYWYAYDPAGNPIFLYGDGTNSGDRIEAQVYFFQGMVWGDFDPDTNQVFEWGTLSITFEDCSHATVQYESTLEYQNGEEFGSGQIALVRLASIDGFQCSPIPVAGLYEGNFYPDTLEQPSPGFVVIAPNGEFSVLIFDSLVGVGSWSTSGNSLSASARVVGTETGQITFSSSFSMSGLCSAGYRMVGDYEIEESDAGTFDLFAVPAVYRKAVPLAEIAGTYRVKPLFTGADGSLTILESGSLSGSDSYGCTYTGQISLPDPNFNLIEFSIRVASCGSWNGTYRGYGAQIDDLKPHDNRVIRLVGKHDKFPAIIDLKR
jgi:hypothetical protein